MKKMKRQVYVLLAILALLCVCVTDIGYVYADVVSYNLTKTDNMADSNGDSEENTDENPDQNPGEKPDKNPNQNPDENPDENPNQNPDENPDENPNQNPDENPDKEPEKPVKVKQEWQADGSLKVLFIGHSYSRDTMQFVYNIGQNLGISNMKLGILYIGGCTLSTHLRNARNNLPAYTYYTNDQGVWNSTPNYRMSDAVNSENWDYICFQQASASSGVARTYDYLVPLLDIVESWKPLAKYAWNMTWAYQCDTDRVEFGAYVKEQIVMYESIVSAVQQKIETNDKIDCILPIGTAIQNARTSYLGDHLTRDGHHLSYDIGRYIAGVAFLHSLIGIDVNAITYMPGGTGTGVRAIAVEAAVNAVKSPFEVTKSEYDLVYRDSVYANNGKGVCVATGGSHVEDQDITPATLSADGYINPTCTKCQSDLDVRTIHKIGSIALSKTSYTYNGKAKKPSVTVTNSLGEALKNGTDYTVEYASGRKYVGTYKVKIKFKGNYSGEKTLEFKVLPKTTKIIKLEKGKTQIKIKWKKVSSQRTGYQIQYSTKKSFSSKKLVRITSNTTSKTIKKLKKNKKYYFRIRTYKTVSGKKYYSAWSSTKTVQTKK